MTNSKQTYKKKFSTILIVGTSFFTLLLYSPSSSAQIDSTKQEKSNLVDSLKQQVKVKKNLFWFLRNKKKISKDASLLAIKDSIYRNRKFEADSLALVARRALDSLYGYGEGKMSLPTRAALLSAALPGLGQYFNRSLWYLKVPLIYGLFGFTTYQILANHKQYIALRDALLYREDGNPLTVSDIRYTTFNNDGLRSRRDAYRRDREFNIILTLGVYMLNVAEAAATAHLKSFDISDDLSLKIHPKTMLLPDNQIFAGVSFRFSLKGK